jgi:hypothetical protein
MTEMMHKVPMPKAYPEEDWFNGPNKAIVESNQAIEALYSINRMLEPYGLEIVEYDWGSSDHLIELRKLGT